MNEYIAVSCTAVFLAFANKFYKKTVLLFLSQFILFLFLALRYEFGNDYIAYSDIFKEISEYSFSQLSFVLDRFEPGWVYLNWLFRDYGFETLVIFTSAFTSIVFYWSIKEYVDKSYYWLATFLYAFNPNILLTDASAMRQNIAILILVISLRFFLAKKWYSYYFAATCACLFHITAVFMLAVPPLVGCIKLSRFGVGIFLILLFLLSASVPLLIQYVPYVLQVLPERFSQYSDPAELNTGLGILNSLILLLFLLYCYVVNNAPRSDLFKMYCIKYFIIPLNFVLQISGRFLLYIEPMLIFVVPNAAQSIKSSTLRAFFIIYVVATTLYLFYSFNQSEIYYEYYNTYKIILNN